jgi:hypothetical protein
LGARAQTCASFLGGIGREAYENGERLIDLLYVAQSSVKQFKDDARKAPTTVTQMGDAFVAVRNTYEDIWNAGERIFP